MHFIFLSKNYVICIALYLTTFQLDMRDIKNFVISRELICYMELSVVFGMYYCTSNNFTLETLLNIMYD